MTSCTVVLGNDMTLEIVSTPASISPGYRIRNFINELAEQPKGTWAVSHRYKDGERKTLMGASSTINRLRYRYSHLEWRLSKDENDCYFVAGCFPPK